MPACRHVATRITQAPDIVSLALSPDGQRLVCLSSDQTVRLLDLSAGGVARKWYVGQAAVTTSPAVAAHQLDGINCRPAYQVAFAPDGRTFAVCAGPSIYVWDAATGDLVRTLQGHAEPVTTVAYSADGRTIATGGRDRQVILWDAATGQRRAALRGHRDTISCVTFRGDNRLLASTSWDGTAILWRTDDGQLLASLDGSDCWVHAAAFSPDGATLATGDIHGRIRLWNLADGQRIASIPAHVEGLGQPLKPAVTLAYSPDGTVLASTSTTGTLKLWDTDRHRDMLELPASSTTVLATAFDPAGETLAIREADGAIRLWDLSTGRCVRSLADPGDTAARPATTWDDPQLATLQDSLAYSPDGRTIAAADGNAITLWDVETGKQTGSFEAIDATAVAFDATGRTLAAAQRNGQVRLYDLPGGRVIHAMQTGQPVGGLAFSPNGLTLACGIDRTVQLWDVQTGRKTAELAGHAGVVWSVAFGPGRQPPGLGRRRRRHPLGTRVAAAPGKAGDGRPGLVGSLQPRRCDAGHK